MNAGGKALTRLLLLHGWLCDGFIAKVGDDIFGRQATELFQRGRIDTSVVTTAKPAIGSSIDNSG